MEKDDRSVRIAAGEALALIFEFGTLEKFAAEANGSADGTTVKEGSVSQEALMHMRGLKAKITNQVRDLSVEAGGKGSAKKDLDTQRNLFKDLVEFLEVYFLGLFFFIGLLYTFGRIFKYDLLIMIRMDTLQKPLQRLEGTLYRRQHGIR